MSSTRRYLILTRFAVVLVLVAVAASVTLRAVTPEPAGASLSGYVVDAESRETLVSATVAIQGTRLGAATNKSGYFSIRGVPPGRYTVSVTYLGYERLDTALVFGDRSLTVTFALRSSSVSTSGVTVTAEREVENREITISRVNIPVAQLTQIRTGGEADLFRALQYLPGVLTSSQISSGLYIRGGSPDQNLVLIDGSTVYNPSHLFGFYSTFNPDAVKDVELIKGGFAPEYGGRMSAVVNLTQKDGNREEIEGIASLGLVASRLSVEGPLGNGSWFIGGRRTYLEAILPFIPEDPESPLPNFWFYDLNAKINQDISSNDRLFLSGFMSKDRLDYEGVGMVFGLDVGNRTGSLRWNHIFTDGLFTTLNVTASDYLTDFQGNQAGFEFRIKNAITDYTARSTVEWFATEDLTIKAGADLTRFAFEFFQNFSGTLDSTRGDDEQSVRLDIKAKDWVGSGYGQVNYQLSPLVSLQAGLRADYYEFRDLWTFDPRAAVRVWVQPEVAVKAAWGIYHQYLRLGALPDFSFFDTWLPTDTTVNPGTATHYILGVESKLLEDIEVNLDLYYKRLQDISELNQFQITATKVSDVFYSGRGTAYGGELFIQKRRGALTGWIGYGLGWIEAQFDSINGGRAFRPKYDRRHDLKIVSQYHLDERWEFGATFVFQSGQSYTAATSRFRAKVPGQSEGFDFVVPAERYALRMPPSHQLNLNVTYSTTLFGNPLRLMLDVFNVYSHRDIWFRNYQTKEKVTRVVDVKLLPIVPTISAEWRF